MGLIADATAAILSQFKSEAGNLRGRLDRTGRDLEAARKRRDELLTLLPPPSEIAQGVVDALKARARLKQGSAQGGLIYAFREFGGDAEKIAGRTVIPWNTSSPAPNIEWDVLLCAMFPEQFKAAIAAIMEGAEYRFGPPRDQRDKELEQLDQKISRLEREELEISSVLAGLRDALVNDSPVVHVKHLPRTISAGVVRLSAEQAKSRRHCLEPVEIDEAGAGTYSVKRDIHFKVGERFTLLEGRAEP